MGNSDSFADSTDPFDHAVTSSKENADEGGEVKYFTLEQHPCAAKSIPKNTSKKWCDLTVEERAFFKDNTEYLVYAAFFGEVPSYNYSGYAAISHNIRAYTLYKLMELGDIKLYSFDSSAALSSLKVSADGDEALVPNSGKFVVEYEGELIVIELEWTYGGRVEWQWFTRTVEVFTRFMQYFNKMSKEYNQYNGGVFDSTGDFISLPDVTLDDIYLEDSIREEIQSNVIDYFDPTKIEIKRKNGLPIKRGVIFEGLPGTGKTFLSRVLAKTLGISFLVVTGFNSANQIRGIFKFARKFDKIIILFEDIDIYAGDRNSGDVVSAILNELDGIGVYEHLIVICTTNRFESLDDALKDRPGRFDRILHFKSPNSALKIEMLKGFCAKYSTNAVDFKKVVSQIPSEYTGAYLKELYITTVTLAIEEDCVDDDGLAVLSTDLFLRALFILRRSRKECRPIGFSEEI